MTNGHEVLRPRHKSSELMNVVGRPGEEPVEPRAGTEGNAEQGRRAPDSEPGGRVPMAWIVNGERLGKGRRRSSPRSSTTSTPARSEEAFFELEEDTPRRASTD